MTKNKALKVCILDIQPIDPPIGGGRIRLLGLYHNLGNALDALYIGSYDWQGEAYRDHLLSETLREINIPLSKEHFSESRKMKARVGGKTIIDSTFSQLAHLSPDYVNFVRSQVIDSDAIIFSHPWVYPLVKDLINWEEQLVIYDSQNVEGYLRYTLLDDDDLGTDIVKSVVKTEYELCHQADAILACSYEDKVLFNKLYNVSLEKVRIAPNGVFSEVVHPAKENIKQDIRQHLDLGPQPTVIFMGSNYNPNIQATHFMIDELAPNLPEFQFIIAGSVGEGIFRELPANVIITGRLTEHDKLLYLQSADLAVNPMFSGSGTNIKMFDYMAAGLPVISTNIGSRGICSEDYEGILIRNRATFSAAIKTLSQDPGRMAKLGMKNRAYVKANYSWETISPKLGKLLLKLLKEKRKYPDPSPARANEQSFALMSSWNLRCGIAEHSRHLVDEFDQQSADFHVIANSNPELTNLYLMDDLGRSIHPLWFYDFTNWVDSKIDTAQLIDTLNKNRVKKFNIQYHTAFFKIQTLLDVVKACMAENIQVFLTLHNSREIEPEYLQELNNLKTTFIVHTQDEKDSFDKKGFSQVEHIPLGVLDFPDEQASVIRNEMGIKGNPVISSFGFLRPYKGVLEVIEAVNILRPQFPDIQFIGINALYPSADSEVYFNKCTERIAELGLENNVTLITSFLAMGEIVHYLHASDLIVLPYYESHEGSSAAANTAVSAKRPLLISNSEIFNSIKPVCHQMTSIEPAIIAKEIQKLVSDPGALSKLKSKAVAYVDQNAYKTAANEYLDLLQVGRPLDYEKLLQKFYESILEPGDIVLDIGAHVGRHTLPIAKKIAPTGKVYAYEPIAKCIDELHQSLASSGNNLSEVVTVYPYALSNKEGISEFTVYVDNPGFSGLIARPLLDLQSNTEKVSVELKTIDTHLANLESLKYIKIDAEGGEFDILKGGVEIITKFRPIVTFEFGANAYKVYDVDPKEVFRFWQDLNYKVYDILGREVLSEDAFAESSVVQLVWDYVAIPNESAIVPQKYDN